MKKRIGILTWHYFLNFGSALQAYALKSTINGLGHRAEIINYRSPKHGNPPYWKDLGRIAVSKIFSKKGFLLGRQITYPFLRFHYDYLGLRKASVSMDWLKNQTKKYDCVVCGSDQIWAPNVLDKVYLLDFVPNKTKKVSYAASIGLNSIPKDLEDVYCTALQTFEAVSVREAKGQELLSTYCGIRSQVVLDPTLLVSADQWVQLERCPEELSLELDKPYVLCYFLNRENTYREQVEKYAKEKGFALVGYSLKEEDHTWMQDITGKIGPSEFLWLVRHAQTVITDSYHGTIFSLLYHKNFLTLKRFRSDDPICQNSRIEQLNTYFSISDHFASNGDSLHDKEIDYNKFEEKLTKLREESINYLKKALGDK